MDTFTEARLDMLDKIARIEDKIDYFTQQAKETDRLFREALHDNLPQDIKDDRLIAKKESEVNLNSEKKALKILKNRLNSGDFNTSFSTPSTLGKRNLDQ